MQNNQTMPISALSTNSKRASLMEVLAKYGVYIFLCLLVIINLAITRNFISINIVWNLIVQGCPIIICSLGMLTVISSGGVDISVGSLMALSSIITVKMLYQNMPIFAACIVAIICTCVFGVVTGFCIGKLHLQPMIVTLGVQMIGRGVAQAINDGHVELFKIPDFSSIGTTKIAGQIPIQLIYIAVLTAFMLLLLSKTKFGRYVQAVGDNPRSCRLSGINTVQITILVYVVCAAFAAMAAIIETARLSTANGNTMGKLMELDAIAAVCIGGTSMNGGKAKVVGAVVGAVIMTLISIMVNMNNVPDAWSYVLKAAVIIGAFYLQNITARRGGR